MKNFKIKLFSFSLLAILAISVFLTSCEQETTLPDIPDTNIENSIEFTLPDHINDLDDEAIMVALK